MNNISNFFEHLNKIINRFLGGILIVDPLTRKILSSNIYACKHLKIDELKLNGSFIFEWFNSPEDIFYWEQSNYETLHSDTIAYTGVSDYISIERNISYIKNNQDAFFVISFLDKTDNQKSEHELEKSLAELKATFESIHEGILITELNGDVRSFNQYFVSLFDLPFDYLTNTQRDNICDYISSRILNIDTYKSIQLSIQRDTLYEGTDILYLNNGKILERNTIIQYSRGQAIGRIYSFRNITQKLEDEKHLRQASKVFEASLDAVIIADNDFNMLSINPAAQNIFKNDKRLNIGNCLIDLFIRSGKTFSKDVLFQIIEKQGHWTGHVEYYKHENVEVSGHVSFVKVSNNKGATENIVIFFKDISEKVQAQNKIEELAYTDILTGLPNRLKLMDRLEYMLPLSKRRNEQFGVVFIDLDRFKNINDSLGHHVGDQVLIDISKKLLFCVREVDMVARLGGDEFVLLLTQTDRKGIEIVLNRVMSQLKEPVIIDEFSFSLSCSMGVAIYPDDGLNSEELIKNADTAMYRVKENGKEGYRFYQPQMNIEMLSRLKMDQEMRSSLGQNKFVLNYQPQISLKTGKILGVEGLLRWTNSNGLNVPPNIFIPVAEESGFIVSLGMWVIEEGIKQSKKWLDSGKDLQVSLNVSALQFKQANFVSQIEGLLNKYDLKGNYLELEVTESILLNDVEDVLEKLKKLSSMGICLAIDDFGTGYSSLSYLKKFPIKRLKIDRSFISDFMNNPADKGIVNAIIMLGESLGMDIVAEGVETQEQADILLKMGCVDGQGYLWSQAVLPEIIGDLC